jgi:hypothetical protein
MEKKLVVTHVEWSSPDPQNLTSFLSGLFGWTFQAFGEDYFIYNPDPGAGVSIGVLRNTEAKPGGTPNIYIEVTSIDESTASALELGGQIAVPKTEIPGMGWYAFVSSPEQNLVGLHQSI